ncbi:MAG TPA: MBL fold metallo-hydrolase, partial [Anaerolineae bacterium]|nr:MBL fold metallo-hydrolase [Anaerolineae bacterium]
MQIRMVRERIADDIYVFTSSEYAQVTAGAIVTKDGVILVDTLYFPHETQAIKEFFEIRLGVPVRYVINTHYHADHTQGTYLFPEAQVISHALCRQLLDTVGRQGLAEAQEEDPELEAVRIELPDMIFSEGMVSLQVGGKTLELWHMPGHSPDVIGVFVTNDRILFASDNMMPVPTLFDGSYTDLARSLQRILEIAPDMIVQGHGEVILRGEMQTAIQSDLDYLAAIRTAVEQVVTNGNTPDSLREIDIESCGKSRIPLNGLLSDLHQANLET